MTRTYNYVVSRRIAEQAEAPISRLAPATPDDIRSWSLAPNNGNLELTFVVDPRGQLWLSIDTASMSPARADSPYSLLASCVPRVTPQQVAVVSVSNQSTGYCPEPDCWPAVRDALRNAGLESPNEFTHAFDFRRCVSCSGINILKDGMPDCPSCGTELTCQLELRTRRRLTNPAIEADKGCRASFMA